MARTIAVNRLNITGGGGYSEIMGAGVDGLAAGDEYTLFASIQNRGSADATIFVGYTGDDLAPDADTDPAVFEITIPADTIQPINGEPVRAGESVWVKSDQTLTVRATAIFAATA